MYSGWNRANCLSDNDKLVLNLIYTLGEGKNFISCQKQIENFIQKYNNNFCTDNNILNNNLLENLTEIADINKNKLQLQNIGNVFPVSFLPEFYFNFCTESP